MKELSPEIRAKKLAELTEAELAELRDYFRACDEEREQQATDEKSIIAFAAACLLSGVAIMRAQTPISSPPPDDPKRFAQTLHLDDGWHGHVPEL